MPPRRKSKPRSADHAALGRAIEELRREAGLSQEELADRIQGDFTSIGSLERGIANPTFSSLLRVVGGLDVAPAELIERFEQLRQSDSGG